MYAGPLYTLVGPLGIIQPVHHVNTYSITVFILYFLSIIFCILGIRKGLQSVKRSLQSIQQLISVYQKMADNSFFYILYLKLIQSFSNLSYISSNFWHNQQRTTTTTTV